MNSFQLLNIKCDSNVGDAIASILSSSVINLSNEVFQHGATNVGEEIKNFLNSKKLWKILQANKYSFLNSIKSTELQDIRYSTEIQTQLFIVIKIVLNTLTNEQFIALSNNKQFLSKLGILRYMFDSYKISRLNNQIDINKTKF